MLHNGKAVIRDPMGAYEVSIPSKKNWFLLIFASLWMGGWYFGLENAISMYESGSESGFGGFIICWILAWVAGGFGIILVLLWGYFGKESLAFDGQEVKFKKTIFGIGIKKNLTRSAVKNFRLEKVNESVYGGNPLAFWGLGSGKVKFDYGLKTYSFGLAADEAEAKYLVEQLNRKIERS